MAKTLLRNHTGNSYEIPPRVGDRVYERLSYSALHVPRMKGACHLWTASVCPDMRPVISWGDRRVAKNAISQRAAAVIYRLEKLGGDPIPPGKFVCHWCDVGTCGRIEHLHLGTHPENMREMALRGTAAQQGVLKMEVYAQVQLRLLKNEYINPGVFSRADFLGILPEIRRMVREHREQEGR